LRLQYSRGIQPTVEMEVEATVMAAEAVVVMERVATGVVAKEVAREVVAKAVAAKAAAKVAVMCPLKLAGMEVVEKAVAVA
jgi:hypothetical protein